MKTNRILPITEGKKQRSGIIRKKWKALNRRQRQVRTRSIKEIKKEKFTKLKNGTNLQN